MDRFAFENVFGIEGFNIAWYGLIIVCGFLLGVLLASYRAKRRRFKRHIYILNISIIFFILFTLNVYMIFIYRF